MRFLKRRQPKTTTAFCFFGIVLYSLIMRKICHTIKQTHKAAEFLAQKILKPTYDVGLRAVVVALSGELGSGKTPFTQGFAKALGIKERITSPTFVLLKRFKMNDSRFKNFIHIDAYRFENSKEILDLGWKEMVNGSKNIILIEWAEKIKKILPKNCFWIKFKHKGPRKRSIDICLVK